jgi:hypothetical protein
LGGGSDLPLPRSALPPLLAGLQARCGKRHFLRCHLYIKCIILPRQARDKHRERSTQKTRPVSAGVLAPIRRKKGGYKCPQCFRGCKTVPAPSNISVKTAEISAIRVSEKIAKTVSRHASETRRGSKFRPFWLGSSRFNVQMSAQKGATTQFESDR